jgi:hypothetical protein
MAPAIASAALWLVFKPAAAAPHALVSARTAGTGALLQLEKSGALRNQRLAVYLGPAAARSVRDRRLVALGRLRVDRAGNGRIRFRVPNVPSGRYRTFVHCVPCARYSGGRALLSSGAFRVLEARPPVRTCLSSVYGELSDDAIARAPRFGPVRLIGYDPAQAARASWLKDFRIRATGQYVVKILLLVDRGPAVTIAVAPADRRAAAVSYIPARFNTARVTGADAATTFSPCQGGEGVPGADSGRTQFNGSFVLARPLCARFELQVAGSEPQRFALPFGRPC